jgi:hypothetical protein
MLNPVQDATFPEEMDHPEKLSDWNPYMCQTLQAGELEVTKQASLETSSFDWHPVSSIAVPKSLSKEGSKL